MPDGNFEINSVRGVVVKTAVFSLAVIFVSLTLLSAVFFIVFPVPAAGFCGWLGDARGEAFYADRTYLRAGDWDSLDRAVRLMLDYDEDAVKGAQKGKFTCVLDARLNLYLACAETSERYTADAYGYIEGRAARIKAILSKNPAELIDASTDRFITARVRADVWISHLAVTDYFDAMLLIGKERARTAYDELNEQIGAIRSVLDVPGDYLPEDDMPKACRAALALRNCAGVLGHVGINPEYWRERYDFYSGEFDRLYQLL